MVPNDFFIFYDPLEFLTGACQTPIGQEMSFCHLCAVVQRMPCPSIGPK